MCIKEVCCTEKSKTNLKKQEFISFHNLPNFKSRTNILNSKLNSLQKLKNNQEIHSNIYLSAKGCDYRLSYQNITNDWLKAP